MRAIYKFVIKLNAISKLKRKEAIPIDSPLKLSFELIEGKTCKNLVSLDVFNDTKTTLK